MTASFFSSVFHSREVQATFIAPKMCIRDRTKTAGLSSVPWKAKLSFVVMGLGQLCYGQIVKGLLYLLSLAGLIVYFCLLYTSRCV